MDCKNKGRMNDGVELTAVQNLTKTKLDLSLKKNLKLRENGHDNFTCMQSYAIVSWALAQKLVVKKSSCYNYEPTTFTNVKCVGRKVMNLALSLLSADPTCVCSVCKEEEGRGNA